MPELEIPSESGNDPRKTYRRSATPLIIYYILLIVMLSIGLYFIYNAIQAYIIGEVEVAGYYSITGIIGVGMSIYMVSMLRRKASTKNIYPKVMTTVECNICGLKKLRKFEKGDYVLKNVENCLKCNQPMEITAIYAEKITE